MTNRILSWASLGCAATIACLCSWSSVVTAQENTGPMVSVATGQLRGIVEGGVENFRGIPYAAAPVGELRFAPPAAPASWEGERTATEFGSACPQTGNLGVSRTENEDCLFVNVQRPIGTADDGALAVLVYFHGGSLMNGTGNVENFDRMVAESGIIAVSVNYRVGALGAFMHPAMTSDGDAAVGNWGLRDQVAALEWVQDNIAGFGGDPDKVTIGGESAGAVAVCSLLATPAAQGLFDAAISMSGACTAWTVAQSEAKGEELATALNCIGDDALACMREVPVGAILDTKQGSVLHYTAGTDIMPEVPYDVLAAGKLARVPVLMGTTRDEGRTFLANAANRTAPTYTEDQYREFVANAFGDDAPMVLKVYPWPEEAGRFSGTYLVAEMLIQNILPGPGGLSPCKAFGMAEYFSGKTPTYVYEFDNYRGSGMYDVPGFVWGAGHAADLAYIMPARGGTGLNGDAFGAADKVLSDEMRARFASFVKSGNPNVEGLVDWPAFAAAAPQILSLERGGESFVVPGSVFRTAHHCELWDDVLTN